MHTVAFASFPMELLIKGYFVLVAVTASILALSIFWELDICCEFYDQDYVLSMLLISHSFQNPSLRVCF